MQLWSTSCTSRRRCTACPSTPKFASCSQQSQEFSGCGTLNSLSSPSPWSRYSWQYLCMHTSFTCATLTKTRFTREWRSFTWRVTCWLVFVLWCQWSSTQATRESFSSHCRCLCHSPSSWRHWLLFPNLFTSDKTETLKDSLLITCTVWEDLVEWDSSSG